MQVASTDEVFGPQNEIGWLLSYAGGIAKSLNVFLPCTQLYRMYDGYLSSLWLSLAVFLKTIQHFYKRPVILLVHSSWAFSKVAFKWPLNRKPINFRLDLHTTIKRHYPANVGFLAKHMRTHFSKGWGNTLSLWMGTAAKSHYKG